MMINSKKYTVYFQEYNKIFKNRVLTICYKASSDEIKKYALTNENILIFIYSPHIDKTFDKDSNYLKDINKLYNNEIILRVQCECLLGMYGDTHCDCDDQREKALEIIRDKGGVYIHFPQEAQGWGLHYKLSELELQVNGKLMNSKYIGEQSRDNAQKILLDTAKFRDKRGYFLIAKILNDIGLSKKTFLLITNSEKKIKELKSAKINVKKYNNVIKENVTSNNVAEYLIKIINNTHNINKKTLVEIIEVLKNQKLNKRTIECLKELKIRLKENKINVLKEDIKNYFEKNVFDII